MEQIFGSIPAVLGGFDASVAVDEAMAIAAWNVVAGDLLRERTVPVGFGEARLIIAVEDNTWKRHLEDLSPQMLAKLNARLGQGTVRFIEFQIDRNALVKAREDRQAAAARAPKPPKAAASLQNAAKAIADDELREHFLAAAATYLERQDGK